MRGGYAERAQDRQGGAADQRQDHGDNGNDKIGAYGWQKLGKGTAQGGDAEVHRRFLRCDRWMICHAGRYGNRRTAGACLPKSRSGFGIRTCVKF
ncbi:hypothetical protein BFS10_09030 [Brucella suis]|nr:hypothetical protein BFS10_09030 [Brucella suis]